MKLAVYLPNWVGDAVMATPAVRALRTEFPRAELVGIMRPVIADVLAGTPWFDAVLLHHPRGSNASQRGWRFLWQLRRQQFDAAILFPNSLRSAWLAWCSGAPERIGMARDGRGWLLTGRVPPKPRSKPHPVLDEYLRIAEAAGCRTLERRMELALNEADCDTLGEFWNRQTFAGTNGYIAFNTGGAFGPAKNWPIASFAQLAQRIVDELGKAVLIVCGPAERADAQAIVARAQRPEVISLAEEAVSIGLTKAAIAAADLLVTTDSGPRHFASAFETPVITLFGPTHIAWSDTGDPKAVHLQQPVPCGPCQQRTCPLGHHRCMTELSVDRVWVAVQGALRRAPRYRSAA